MAGPHAVSMHWLTYRSQNSPLHEGQSESVTQPWVHTRLLAPAPAAMSGSHLSGATQTVGSLSHEMRNDLGGALGVQAAAAASSAQSVRRISA
jgi:hypothetical protein